MAYQGQPVQGPLEPWSHMRQMLFTCISISWLHMNILGRNVSASSAIRLEADGFYEDSIHKLKIEVRLRDWISRLFSNLIPKSCLLWFVPIQTKAQISKLYNKRHFWKPQFVWVNQVNAKCPQQVCIQLLLLLFFCYQSNSCAMENELFLQIWTQCGHMPVCGQSDHQSQLRPCKSMQYQAKRYVRPSVDLNSFKRYCKRTDQHISVCVYICMDVIADEQWQQNLVNKSNTY